MISSGPDTHEEVSGSDGSRVFALLLFFGVLGLGGFGAFGVVFFFSRCVEAITQDSPSGRSIICSVDMSQTYPGLGLELVEATEIVSKFFQKGVRSNQRVSEAKETIV
jgi:hypothetical protein